MSEKQANKLALFPIYLWDQEFDPAECKGTYYVVTGKGIFLNKETQAGSFLLPVAGIPWLESPSMEFRLDLPKIPGLIIAKALTFFRTVFEKYQSESYVTLLYSKKLNKYMLWCPKQKVSRTSVNYDRTDQPAFDVRQEQGWNMVGTIHSHCDFSAFHSGTDVHDEDSFDGIHITLGHVNRQQISMESSISVNKNREKIEPENCCGGVVRVCNKDVVNSGHMVFNKENTHFFDIELDEQEVQQLAIDTEEINRDWFSKVEKEKAFFQYKNWTGAGFSGSMSDYDDLPRVGHYYSSSPKKKERNIEDKMQGWGSKVDPDPDMPEDITEGDFGIQSFDDPEFHD